jgi:superkiller protein 3
LFALHGFAQETPQYARAKADLYNKWRDNYNKGPEQQKLAYRFGKEYISRYGAVEDVYLQAVRQWVAAYERAFAANDPTNQYFQQALEHQKAGRYKEAIELYRRVVEYVPNNAAAYYNMGLAYSLLDQYQDALAAFRQATNIDPNHHLAYWGMGNVYNVTKQYAEAVNAYGRSISINQNFVGAHLGLADARMNLRQFREALAEYNRALSLDPKNALAHRAAGLASYNLNQFGDALAAFQRSAQIAPNDPATHDLMGATYHELGRSEDAAAATRRAISLRPDDASVAGSYVSLSWYYSFSDQHQASLDAARHAATLAPREQMAFTNICRALNDLGKPNEALVACRRALELKPGDGETLYYQGIAYGKLGQKPRALEAYRLSVAAFEREQNGQADILYLRGNVNQQLQRDAEAIESYRAAISLRPNFAQARLNLGAMYAVAGNQRAAMEEYNQLRQVDPARADKLLRVIQAK